MWSWKSSAVLRRGFRIADWPAGMERPMSVVRAGERVVV
jgi:hypothetical protein